MINEEIAEIFEKMARVLAFKGENRFRVLAYERAAVVLRDTNEDIAGIAAEGRLEELPGIGKDMAAMITEYLATGHIKRCEKEWRGLGDELIELMDIPGLGPKTLARIHARFRIKNIEDLQRVLTSGQLLTLPGFGTKKIENLQRGVQMLLASRKRMPLGSALPLAERLLELAKALPDVERADIAGSLRRHRETIGDLDLLIISRHSPRALLEITQLPLVKRVLALGETRATMIIEGGVQVDVRAVAASAYGAALQYFTGSKQHNVRLRTVALERGLKVNEYGVFRGARRLGGAHEKDVYRLLGLSYIPPELREDRGEIDSARAGKLPALVEVRALRGDLHAHTTYSDGRSSIAEMVARAAQLGYEYIALTDHSPHARVANGLSRERLEEKITEIERVRKQWKGKKPYILMGAEVDILADGRLDYPDEILARLDVVVASIHSSFALSRERQTERLLAAIDNRYVNIIGHPTTRIIGGREPIEFDFEKVVACAALAGVALEVNGSPRRLDLNELMARAAQQAGALIAIDSDAHSAESLAQIRYGVYQARRGWIEARSVVNTWPYTKLITWLRARRNGRTRTAAA